VAKATTAAGGDGQWRLNPFASRCSHPSSLLFTQQDDTIALGIGTALDSISAPTRI
jgi:hypothetical protein